MRAGSRVALAGLAGVGIAAAFPPLEYSSVAWVAVAPLALAVRDVPPRRACALGWLAGTVAFLLITAWVVETVVRFTAQPRWAAHALHVAMCAILGLYTGAFAAALRAAERRGISGLWVAGPLWGVTEWLRGWLVVGFPWANLGDTQHATLAVAQLAEPLGVFGVSALLAHAGYVVARVCVAPRASFHAAAVFAVAVAALVGWGAWRLAVIDRTPAADRVMLALVPGAVRQDEKWRPEYADEILARYTRLTVQAAEEAHPDLVVWPETATPSYFAEPGAVHDAVVGLARQLGVPLLLGSPALERDGGVPRYFNRAYLLDAEGAVAATYDKIALVPFGEYVPLARLLFFWRPLVRWPEGMTAGTTPRVLALPRLRVGVLVCYESAFPWLARTLAAAGADLLVNLANDAWFEGTPALAQSLAHAQMRAIETRLPVVRVANNGISAVIAPSGRIVWTSRPSEPGWHVAEVPVGRRAEPAGQHG
jgi:apolipoprotein N-acyltransferase